MRLRGVAQSGSVLASGARGREFESRYPDRLFYYLCVINLGAI